jgi:hypothetical protein
MNITITYDKNYIFGGRKVPKKYIKKYENDLAFNLYSNHHISNIEWTNKELNKMFQIYGVNYTFYLINKKIDIYEEKFKKYNVHTKKELADFYKYFDKTKKEIKKYKLFKKLESIIRTKLPKNLTIFLYSENVHIGHTFGNIIHFGHTEDWKCYTIVYLAHEAIHALLNENNFKQDHISHAIIELCTDYHLRYLLSGYQTISIGHPYLTELRTKILPYFEKYLESTKDIFKFIEEMRNIFEIQQVAEKIKI